MTFKLLAEVEGAKPATADKPASSPVWRCNYSPNGPMPPPGDPANLLAMLKRTVAEMPSRSALGWRPTVDGKPQPYKFMTYAELDRTVTAVGSALRTLQITPGAAVGIYASNCAEWMIAMKAVDWAGGLCVPMYDTFGAETIEYIVGHAGIKVILCASANLGAVAQMLPRVKGQVVQVVVWNSTPGAPLDDAALQEAGQAGVPVTAWDKLVALGASDPGEPSPGGPDDLCTIMYTSGTTGKPKGVEITHRAVLTTVGALIALIRQFGVPFGEGDVFLSYLPLAHIFDRVAEEAFLALGASIGYWQGSPKTLMDDVAALRPTIFVGVPRIFDRIYTGVTEKVAKSGWLSQTLFRAAFALKNVFLRFGICNVPIVDQLVFSKVKDRLGGRVKVVVSGGAPLAQHVERFLKITMCCPVSQGYGLTETCGASFVANPYDPGQIFTVGAPVAGLDLRLEAIPDMGYDPSATPPRGEVCVRGPAVFTAYHKEAEKTREAKDNDGWFHSGDVGELTADGGLVIIDRLKNFFKLSHGEYVAAEKLENVYKKVALVDQIWVYGDSTRNQLVAVVVPDAHAFKQWAQQNGKSADLQTICGDESAATYVQKELEAEGRGAGGLKGFEIVKMVHLTPDAFTVENDLMTPSFKLKRPQLKSKFEAQVQQMYSKLP